MKIVRFINSILKSNSYIIYFDDCDYVFVIDPGDSKPIIDWLKYYDKTLKGLLITHAHFDHIYGVNNLHDVFPNIEIYASKYAKDGMLSSKLNCSYYTENPFVVECKKINIVDGFDTILLWENIVANVIYTPGHNHDCLSYEIGKNLFTGDALIPGIKVHTKSKFSDKAKAENSIQRIIEQFDNNTMIWPGHENNCLLSDLKMKNY